jgi:hypothetical protein
MSQYADTHFHMYLDVLILELSTDPDAAFDFFAVAALLFLRELGLIPRYNMKTTNITTMNYKQEAKQG